MFKFISTLISPKPSTRPNIIETPEGTYLQNPEGWDELFLAHDPICPDCGGKGFGCCVNADIPLPGTSWD